jgi:hypothetical protein
MTPDAVPTGNQSAHGSVVGDDAFKGRPGRGRVYGSLSISTSVKVFQMRAAMGTLGRIAEAYADAAFQ